MIKSSLKYLFCLILIISPMITIDYAAAQPALIKGELTGVERSFGKNDPYNGEVGQAIATTLVWDNLGS